MGPIQVLAGTFLYTIVDLPFLHVAKMFVVSDWSHYKTIQWRVTYKHIDKNVSAQGRNIEKKTGRKTRKAMMTTRKNGHF